jgi:Ca2+-binding RTX toxin-like protein
MYTNPLLESSLTISDSNFAGKLANSELSTLLLSRSSLDLAVPQSLHPLSPARLAAQTAPSSPTNLILDFDGGNFSPTFDFEGGGGLLQISRDGPRSFYGVPNNAETKKPAFGVTFDAFSGFSKSSNPISPSEREEQILQILAGVREDFARFNVNVIWDDRGVSSEFYSDRATVVGITDSDSSILKAGTNLLGKASGGDTGKTSNGNIPDTALVFASTIRNNRLDTSARIREAINTISHEAGHTFGLQHPDSRDVTKGINLDLSLREVMGTGETDTQPDTDLDSEFRTEQLQRQNGGIYDDVGRLNQTLGSSAPAPDDLVSNQTLPSDSTRVPSFDFIPVDSFRSVNDFLPSDYTKIDFAGDRDAYKFNVSTSGALNKGKYTIRVTSSAFTPVFTVWDDNGDFMDVCNSGKYTSTFVPGRNYFVVVGTLADRAKDFSETDGVTKLPGNLPDGQTGAYTLEIGNSAPIAVDEQFTVVENSSVFGDILANDSDPDGNPIRIAIPGKVSHGILTLKGSSFTYTPEPDFFGTDSFRYIITDELANSREATVFFTVTEAPLINLIGTPGRDVLVGTNGRDRIIGLQSGDILTGGKGRDLFVFQNINEGGDRITDFTPGKDKIDFSGLLKSINYTGSDPIADSIISFSQASDKLSVIQVDPDGPKLPGFRVVPFILLDNVTIADLSNPDNFIFA